MQVVAWPEGNLSNQTESSEWYMYNTFKGGEGQSHTEIKERDSR